MSAERLNWMLGIGFALVVAAAGLTVVWPELEDDPDGAGEETPAEPVEPVEAKAPNTGG